MKKILGIILVTIAAGYTCAQTTESVKLQWKIAADETVVYRTLMSEIDTNKVEFNFGNLFNSLLDSNSAESKKVLDKIQRSFSGTDLVSLLKSENEVVKIEMKTVDQEKLERKVKNDAEINRRKLMECVEEDVVLRGSVYKSGGIESFWLKSHQKNLLAIFFELPKGEVKIGDTWNIEVNFIGNDQNFECDSSYRKNEVTLLDLKVVEGDTIAVLNYDIQEFVSGKFNSPFSDRPTKTEMFMTHQAIAEFSMTKGRWQTYSGIMTLTSSGIMTSNSKKSFSLLSVE